MRFRTILARTVLVLVAGIASAQARISARCHGADLSGTYEIPPLVGRFMPYWSGSTLDALFDYVSTAMPLDHPGALGAGANADIVAFILKSNDIPSGSKELSPTGLKVINFDSANPASRRTRT